MLIFRWGVIHHNRVLVQHQNRVLPLIFKKKVGWSPHSKNLLGFQPVSIYITDSTKLRKIIGLS